MIVDENRDEMHNEKRRRMISELAFVFRIAESLEHRVILAPIGVSIHLSHTHPQPRDRLASTPTALSHPNIIQRMLTVPLFAILPAYREFGTADQSCLGVAEGI